MQVSDQQVGKHQNISENLALFLILFFLLVLYNIHTHICHVSNMIEQMTHKEHLSYITAKKELHHNPC